jgi:hypothetical protein
LSREDNKEYLSCSCVYPPLEVSSLRRGNERRPDENGDRWESWDEALQNVENSSLVDFYKSEIAQPTTEKALRYRDLIYRIGGKRRLIVSCRSKYAYVWQSGRFAGDDQYWRGHLSKPESVQPVKEGQGLRFHIVTSGDFSAFSAAVKDELRDKEFSEPADFQEPDA